jgi:hypothetical protein
MFMSSVISFQIFLFHQHLDPLFDAADLWHKVVLDSVNGEQLEMLIIRNGGVQIILPTSFDRVLGPTRFFGLQEGQFRQVGHRKKSKKELTVSLT